MICQDFNLSRSFFPCCLGFSISHQKKNFAKQKTTGTRKLKSQVVKGINLGGRGDTSPSPPSSLHTCPLVSFLKCVQRERRIWDFRGRCWRMREQDETEGFCEENNFGLRLRVGCLSFRNHAHLYRSWEIAFYIWVNNWFPFQQEPNDFKIRSGVFFVFFF